MVDLIKRDPFFRGLAWPTWDDFDEPASRGLKIHETDTDIVAEAVVAGVPAKDVDVHIENGVLTVKAEKSEEKKEEGAMETSTRRYYYTAALSGGAWDKAKAEVEDGVITITIPKAEAAKPRKVKVTTKKK